MGSDNQDESELIGFGIDLLRRLSIFTGSESVDEQLGGRSRSLTMSSIEDVSREKNDESEFWRNAQPADMTSPLSIKRKTFNRSTRRTSQERHHSDDITSEADDDNLVSSETRNDATALSHVNKMFKSEFKLHGEYFVSAFGRKGKQINEYQDAKDITCLPDGRLLITDYINSRLQISSSQEGAVTVFSSDVTPQPWSADVTIDNNLAVTVCNDKVVKIFNQNGELLDTFGSGYFIRPTGLAVDKTGNMIVCDSLKDEVSIFDSEGKFVKNLGKSNKGGDVCFSKPSYVCVSVTGDIIVSDTGHHMIKIFDSDGKFVRSFGSFGKKDRQLKCPYGVCTNKFGDILVADHYNSRISMFTRDGVFSRHLVTSDNGLVHPQGLAISGDTLYVTHGHLKATEILVFKLSSKLEYSLHNGHTISYV